MQDRITYKLPYTSYTLYGREAMPKYKWLFTTYKTYIMALGLYGTLFMETTRGMGFWFCFWHIKAVLKLTGGVFSQFMSTPANGGR